jgi:hypothetical protein
MRKTKGLSFEDKRKKMLEIFKADPSFFHLKDIEKLGVKKGIVYQSIKEVLDSLVADNLVETDKIGSSNFFWALPSKIYQVKKNTVDKNNVIIETLQNENETLKQKYKEEKATRKETDERKEKLNEFEELNRKIEEYNKELNIYKKNDPVRYQNVLHDSKQFVILNDLWKDNVLAVNQWMKSKSPDVNLVEMFPELESLNLFDD